MTVTIFHIDSTGHIQNRRIKRDAALLVSEEMLSKRSLIKPTLPAGYEKVFDGLMEELAQKRDGLGALVLRLEPAPRPVPTVPTEEALAIESKEVLKSVGLLNSALDWRASALKGITDSAIKRLKGTAKQEAGVLLDEHFFEDGLKFTQVSYDQQWLEFNRRFEKVPTSVMDAARLLAGDDLVVESKVLNVHYGRLLGLTESSSSSPVSAAMIRAVHSELVTVLMRVVAFGFVAWPGQDGDDATHRAQLVEIFFENLR